jgi:hypothetical protein
MPISKNHQPAMFVFHPRFPRTARAMFSTAAVSLAVVLGANADDGRFLPGHLAVLRAGDGKFNLSLKQSPIFVDQFDANEPGAAPSFSVQIPTNGPSAFFFNGHAGSEGNLTRSANSKFLTFAGYGGVDLLQVSGTASRLDIRRGFGTLDSSGKVSTILYKAEATDGKANPRGVATDGTNGFWGCGNANGTFYYDPKEGRDPIRFKAFPNSRAVRLIGGALYVTMNSADAYAMDKPAGIYAFVSSPMPKDATAGVELVVAADPKYKKVVGFDISPKGDVAYMSDIDAGVQKYTKTGSKWTFAYNLSIPQNIPAPENTSAGCFGLVVDFSKSPAVIFATTTEGYGGSVNSNRVVRIVDTGANAAVKTLAQAGSTNIVYRGIDFTPN